MFRGTRRPLSAQQRALLTVTAIVAFLICGFLYVMSSRENVTYETDGGCRQGFALPPNDKGGLCHVAAATIGGTSRRGFGRTTRFNLYLNVDGENAGRTVEVSNATAYPTYLALRRGGSLRGEVQFDRDTIVMIKSDAGTIRTTAHPARQTSQYGIWAIMAGGLATVLLVISALRMRA